MTTGSAKQEWWILVASSNILDMSESHQSANNSTWKSLSMYPSVVYLLIAHIPSTEVLRMINIRTVASDRTWKVGFSRGWFGFECLKWMSSRFIRDLGSLFRANGNFMSGFRWIIQRIYFIIPRKKCQRIRRSKRSSIYRFFGAHGASFEDYEKQQFSNVVVIVKDTFAIPSNSLNTYKHAQSIPTRGKPRF